MKPKMYHWFLGCFSFQLNLFLIWLISWSNECEWWPMGKERTWECSCRRQPLLYVLKETAGPQLWEKLLVWHFPSRTALRNHAPHFGLITHHGNPCLSTLASFSGKKWPGKCYNPPFPHCLPTQPPPRPSVWERTGTASRTRGSGSCRAWLAPFGSAQATLQALCLHGQHSRSWRKLLAAPQNSILIYGMRHIPCEGARLCAALATLTL